MAALYPYIAADARAGQQVELKLHEIIWKSVGRGDILALSDFDALPAHQPARYTTCSGPISTIELLSTFNARWPFLTTLSIFTVFDSTKMPRFKGGGAISLWNRAIQNLTIDSLRKYYLI